MENIEDNDISIVADLGGKLNTTSNFNTLKVIYTKLEFLCKKLEKHGFDYQIRKDPRNQGGGFKYLQEYLWAKVYPKEYYTKCKEKFSYVIAISDSLHFHMMGIKDYQNMNASLNASKKSYSEIDPASYETLVNEFLAFDKRNRKFFIETAANLKIEYFQKQLKDMNNTDIINLLKHKKQIILQGPPGTGKTRLAKKLAQELVGNDFVQLKKVLIVGNKIANASGVQEYYTIKAVRENSVVLTSERAKQDWEPTYEKIIEKLYQLKNGETPTNVNGLHPYELAVAKHVFSNGFKLNKSYQLIQFHPSYSYEDFIRGISVKNNEHSQIEYKTEDKVLVKLAKEALTNYKNHFKDNKTYNKEVKLNEFFKLFTDKILDDIDNNSGRLELTENVGIIGLDSDAFRYKGKEGWTKNGLKMLFKDIVQAFLDGNTERQDIKKNQNLSGSAIQHASYFVRVLNMFQQFLKDENLTFENTTVVKEPLKNYVLIIDEINRANLSSVLGELIYALEYRGEPVESMYDIDGDNKIILPPNLFIIGTMNTADRSVGQIDYAIRRRFAFVDVLPKVILEADLNANKKENDPELCFHKEMFEQVAKLFVNNEELTDKKLERSEFLSDEFEPKDVWLGHSYFIHEKDNFNMKLEYEIKPILREYVQDGILKEAAIIEIEKL